VNFDLQESDLDTVLAEGAFLGAETTRVFGRLSSAQLNWKPLAREWRREPSAGSRSDHDHIAGAARGDL
jgi:hypothetical protein